MLNLRLVFQLVNDGLDNVAFTQQQLVTHEHEAVLHIGANTRNQVQSVFQQALEQRLREIALVAKQLAPQSSHQARNGRCDQDLKKQDRQASLGERISAG